MSVTLRIGGTDGTYPSESLNLANANFRRVMALVGLEEVAGDEGLCGTFAGPALQHLRDQVAFALDGVQAMPTATDGGEPDEVTATPDGPVVIECGLFPGYFADRLTRLLAIIDLAIERGQPIHYD